MKLKYIFLTLAAVTAFTATAHADTMNFFAESGLTGNTWTWSLPQSPTPDTFSFSDFSVTALVSMNGGPATPESIRIFNASILSFACGDTPTTFKCHWDDTAAPFDPFYTGTTQNPTFVVWNHPDEVIEWNYYTDTNIGISSGAFSITDATATAVPEPSSLALLGLGLVLLLPLKYTNRVFQRRGNA